MFSFVKQKPSLYQRNFNNKSSIPALKLSTVMPATVPSATFFFNSLNGSTKFDLKENVIDAMMLPALIRKK